MHALLRAGLIALALSVSPLLLSRMAAAADTPLPPSLRDWQGWVLHGEEFRRCPFVSTPDLEPGELISQDAYRCAWPERLTLAVDSRGGTFSQRWQIHADSWVTLPGDEEHWPRDVRLNGAPAPVVAHGDRPGLRLAPGSYTVSGRFEWASRPESLALPLETAIVDLFVDGARVPQPERPEGGVWLGKRRSAQQAAAMEVQVYRLVRDDIPVYLVTRIRLNVAGEAREEQLARVLPDGFTPVSLQGGVPARLDRDGTLRVQVRAGSHDVVILARGATVGATLGRPDTAGGAWPKEEVWSFAAHDLLRVATASGAEGIDPAQANVPEEWRQYPAFRMDAAARLTIEERSRGLANLDDNRLLLHRTMWLDFDHGGFTVVDNISGQMRRDWRLDMHAPFSLQSARQDGDLLLVTQGTDGRAGVELRQPRLALSTVARKSSGSGAMPATGWDSRFDDVSGTLYLPPGHRLLAALGTDSAPGSWWERWGLWDVFGVLLIVGFVYWTAGLLPAIVAGLALALTYQEMPGYIWLWGNLLAALSVARAAPEGRFRRFAGAYRTVSFVVLGLALLPFVWLQVRYALYPQLGAERQDYSVATQWAEPPRPMMAPPEPRRDRNLDGVAADAAAPAADAAAAVAAAVDAIAVEDVAELPDSNLAESLSSASLNSKQVVQRYAAGTVLQAGPGIPAWQYNAYSYSWSGPVTAEDEVRFVYVGPVVLFFWRILGVIGLVALFTWLAMLSFGKSLRLPGLPKSATAALPGLIAPALLAVALAGAAGPTAAASPEPGAPGDDVLRELKSRLTGAPACAPSCAEITAGRVLVEGDRLEVTLQVSALANVVVAMPNASDRWQLDEVTVDARGALAIARGDDATLWVPLLPGAHTVRLAGRLASAESIQLAFPQPPRVIDVNARGWTTSGVNEGRLVSGSLELARERGAEKEPGAMALEAGAEFPAFVKVHRLFNLDLDWTMNTTVVRVAPQRAAMSVEIPLVPGESVLSPEVKVRNNEAALVGLNAGQTSQSWVSGLARAETLELSLPEGAPRTEVWNFLVNPQWNVEFEGFAPVLPEHIDGRNWMFRYVPRPGEKLSLKVTRPVGVKGSTLAVDSVNQFTDVGARLTTTQLNFTYRSTQGGRHVIRLPADARVKSVAVDGQPQQLRPEKGELPLSLTPGLHRFEIHWDESRDVGLRTRPSTVDLGTPASNLDLRVRLAESRWILAAWGPGVGPAVLYWGELVVFIAVAWFLGRWARSPLRFHEWLLLGLGLSTQSWFVFALTAAWLVTLRWREGWQPPADFKRWRYNTVQVVLAAFTFVTILTLVFSGIRNGLLAQPDMHIENSVMASDAYSWFIDQTRGAIEGPTLISVPMWVYRVLFFAWALWMAFALVRWLRWAFHAWKSGGLWRSGRAAG